MKKPIEITLSELHTLAAPILDCIQKITEAQEVAESEFDLTTVTLENERCLLRLFARATDSVAQLANSERLRSSSHILEGVYSNLNARPAQITQIADQLRGCVALTLRKDRLRLKRQSALPMSHVKGRFAGKPYASPREEVCPCSFLGLYPFRHLTAA